MNYKISSSCHSITNVFFTQMQAKTRKPELSIIAGCLQGLTGYLANFTQSAEEGTFVWVEKLILSVHISSKLKY